MMYDLIIKAQPMNFFSSEQVVQIAEDKTLVDLHRQLFERFDFDDETHLFQFRISGKRFLDPRYLEMVSRVGEPEDVESADQSLFEAGLNEDSKFDYTFDFGSELRLHLIVERAVSSSP